jgi:HTH-type transcriptional regulator, sugar sensing transcriptional regulator
MAASAERLVELGLTTYEAKAYLGLVRRDASSAAEVARLARIPRQRIYDVLSTLVHKGLAKQRPGSPTRYSAVAPEFAIERLVLARREELDRIERTSREMIEALTPAFAAGQQERDPLDYIEVLRDRNAINERFGELQENIHDEILVFTKPPYAKPAQENLEGLEVSRKHKARSVYEYSALEDPDFAAGVRRFIEAGEEARFVEELPLKLVIIDEKFVMFGMEDPVAGQSELTIVVVEHSALAKILKVAFDTVWQQGVTIDEVQSRRPTKRPVRAA